MLKIRHIYQRPYEMADVYTAGKGEPMKKKIIAVVLAAAMLAGGCTSSVSTSSVSTGTVSTGTDSTGTDSNGSLLKVSEVERETVEQPEAVYNNQEIWMQRLYQFSYDTAANLEGDTWIYSPYSLYQALGVLANGASGKAYEELTALLCGSELTLDEVNELSGNYLDELTWYEDLDMRLNTLLTVSQDYELDPEFVQNAVQYYNADTATADFSQKETKDALNDWIEEQTNGMIKDMIGDEVDESTVMLLLNAIYYKGRWSNVFDEDKTDQQTFHGDQGDQTVDMMHLDSEDIYYLDAEEYEVVGLPYKDFAAVMYIILPKEGSSPEDLYGELAQKTNSELMGDSREVILSLPKFTLESDLGLETMLKAAGTGTIFDGGLTGIADGEHELYVDAARQKAKIIVDEEGTEAAAVTEFATSEAALMEPLEPVTVTVDRPFLALLSINNAPAFLARVGNIPAE